jgi:hemerythrin
MHWRNEYSLGIVEIDSQHKQLIGHFGTIEEAIRQGQNWSSIYFLVAELRDFARFHFTCEEALMRLFDFPVLRLHTAEHAHLFKVLAEIEKNSINKAIERELVEFLRVWMTKHIVGSDRGFAQHVLSGAAVVCS